MGESATETRLWSEANYHLGLFEDACQGYRYWALQDADNPEPHFWESVCHFRIGELRGGSIDEISTPESRESFVESAELLIKAAKKIKGYETPLPMIERIYLNLTFLMLYWRELQREDLRGKALEYARDYLRTGPRSVHLGIVFNLACAFGQEARAINCTDQGSTEKFQQVMKQAGLCLRFAIAGNGFWAKRFTELLEKDEEDFSAFKNEEKFLIEIQSMTNLFDATALSDKHF